MGNYATHTAWLPSGTTQSHLIVGLNNAGIQTSTLVSLISRRESFIDGFLAQEYAVPMTQCSMITQITEDLVTYDIYKLLYNRDGGLQTNETIDSMYNMSLSILENISTGKMKVVDSSGNIIAKRDSSSRFYVNTSKYLHTFDEGNELNWGVSVKKLDNLDDLRENDQS
jgi:phage gp36-like protein